jgi:hypothetical protein
MELEILALAWDMYKTVALNNAKQKYKANL